MNKTPTLLLAPALLIASSAYGQVNSLFSHNPDSGILTTVILLIACGLIQLAIIIRLYSRYRELNSREKDLKNRYELLNQQLTERSEKLYNINNQLYEEIAKHETTGELLEKTRDYLQNIINSMPSMLIGVDRNGVISHWNTAAKEETHIPYSEALGNQIQHIMPNIGISPKSIATAIDRKKPHKREGIQDGFGSNARYKDITIYPLSTTDTDGAVIRIDDITLRIRLENMMIQNEKMGSLGELAAGVAHEINNPLGAILQSIQNIQRRLSNQLPDNIDTAEGLNTDLATITAYLEKRKVTAFLEDIKDAGERAAKIVTNMLEFSRPHNQHELINLVEVLNNSLNLAISSASTNRSHDKVRINVIRRFPDECPMIYGSTAEIQQVILNLVSNAYQAFVEAEEIKETTADTPSEPTQLDILINLSFTQTKAIITVFDNGPGMDSWTQRHIFDPFFTTKDVGKGTGLGLSVSYFIITEHHNGSIEVESQKGNGTTFTISLPIDKQTV